MPGPRFGTLRFAAVLVMLLAGCDGPQSALDPAGTEAQSLAALFFVMLAAAAIIWTLVIGLAVYAIRFGSLRHSRRAATALIIGGGAVFPTVVLTILLTYGLSLMRDLRAPADADSVRVRVAGELWWWRVTYVLPDGKTIESANEVRLPRGQRIAFELTSPGVIHSFWVPALGGKIDLIPGRVNRLVLEPTRTGVYRGQCAEYCGTAHALMAFSAVVMEPGDFRTWLRHAAEPAQPPQTDAASKGQEIFLRMGCGACHAVRGTEAGGRLGPDLTHVGSRETLGAGILPNTPDAFARWISHTQEIKADVRMPSFYMLPRDELQALGAYLESLQ